MRGTSHEPVLKAVAGGWAAHGKGWAVHGSTPEEAIARYYDRKKWRDKIDGTVTPKRVTIPCLGDYRAGVQSRDPNHAGAGADDDPDEVVSIT
jgi:hypothetical protein